MRPSENPSRSRTPNPCGPLDSPYCVTARAKPTPKIIPATRAFPPLGNAIEKYSNNAPTVSIKINPENNHVGLQPMSHTSSGTPTPAVMNLSLRLASTGPHRRVAHFIELLVGAAEPPSPPLVFEQRLEIFLFSELGP